MSSLLRGAGGVLEVSSRDAEFFARAGAAAGGLRDCDAGREGFRRHGDVCGNPAGESHPPAGAGVARACGDALRGSDGDDAAVAGALARAREG